MWHIGTRVNWEIPPEGILVLDAQLGVKTQFFYHLCVWVLPTEHKIAITAPLRLFYKKEETGLFHGCAYRQTNSNTMWVLTIRIAITMHEKRFYLIYSS